MSDTTGWWPSTYIKSCNWYS